LRFIPTFLGARTEFIFFSLEGRVSKAHSCSNASRFSFTFLGARKATKEHALKKFINFLFS
jgi:hypothetical protein